MSPMTSSSALYLYHVTLKPIYLFIFSSYIRAAVVALIPGYPQTRQFIPKVLKDLLKQLHSFMTANPTSKFMTEAKLIKMAVDSILLDK